jgi:hypothetical protein
VSLLREALSPAPAAAPPLPAAAAEAQPWQKKKNKKTKELRPDHTARRFTLLFPLPLLLSLLLSLHFCTGRKGCVFMLLRRLRPWLPQRVRQTRSMATTAVSQSDVRGVVQRICHRNSANGFSVVEVADGAAEPAARTIQIAGRAPLLFPGEEVRLTAPCDEKWRRPSTHFSHGPCFRRYAHAGNGGRAASLAGACLPRPCGWASCPRACTSPC